MSKLNFKGLRQTRFSRLTAMACAILVFVMVLALSNSTVGAATDNNYKTNLYSVKYVINEDRTCDVTEHYDVDFVVPSHGLYRNIPLTWKSQFRYECKDRTEKNKLSITDVKCSDNFEDYRDAGQKIIKIGDADELITGPKSYEVSYKIITEKDSFDDFDYIFDNIKPTGWRTDIDKFKFEVVFPKEVKDDSIQLYDEANSIPVEKDKYTVENKDGKTYVYGEFDNVKEGVPVSIFATMGEGYFSKAISYSEKYIKLWLGGSFAFLILAVILYFIFGRDPKIIKTVEFYPPEDMGPVELAGCIDELDSKKVITATIIYLADKGYLTLTRKDEAGENMTISRIDKDEEAGLEVCYQSFLNTLFGSRETIDLDGIDGDTWGALQEIVGANLVPPNSVGRVNDRKSSIVEGFTVLLYFILAGAFSVLVYMKGLVLIDTAVGIAVIGLAGLISYGLINSAVKLKEFKSKSSFVIKNIAALVIMALCAKTAAGLTVRDFGTEIYGLAAAAMIFVAMHFVAHIDKITEAGALIRGRILGFKEFLVLAEEDKLDKLVEENPNYFFNILPYTYIFGISDKWIKRINEKIKEPPSWYIDPYMGYGGYFYLGSMMNSINHHVSDGIAESIANQASSLGSSGGSTFTGGFGGGGMGGGGGGSW